MKPQTARWIFYTGTTVSLVLFIALTADTHRQIRVLTHADRLTDQVVAGKKVWHKYNCNDCHTILGFGSYYGPDLTTVYLRRGPDRIRTAIMTPERATSWRKMPHLALSETEMADLLAFFEWTGGIDTHDWPPQDRRYRARAAMVGEAASPPPAETGVAGTSPGAVSGPGAGAATVGAPRPAETPRDRRVRSVAGRALGAGISTGAELFRERGCFDCHRLEGIGGDNGPDLTRVGSRLTAAHIDSLLADPASVNPAAEMPQPELTAVERAELARFLSTLRGAGGGNGR